MTPDQLATRLQETGTATLYPAPGQTARDCRNILIDAAKKIDVRIGMKRMLDPERIVATALTPEESERQMERDFLFRAVNDMRSALMHSSKPKTKLTPDEAQDLAYIAEDLEDYAREIGGGDEDSLLSFLKRHLLDDEST